MTAIIGQMANGAAYLGADTRRRNHATGDITLKHKLHKWSDQVIFAQGGAGRYGADAVIDALRQNQHAIGPRLTNLIEALRDLAPRILDQAAVRWHDEGSVLPPTFLTLATVCEQSGRGQIWSADLHTGETIPKGQYPQPFFTGTQTQDLLQTASMINYHLRNGLLDPLPFDRLVTQTLETLGARYTSTIQLPADIGFVTWDRETGQWRSEIVVDAMPGQPLRPDFLAWFGERPRVVNDL